MTKDQIFEFFRRLAEDNPSPETELEYGNAYQLVVAVALQFAKPFCMWHLIFLTLCFICVCKMDVQPYGLHGAMPC